MMVPDMASDTKPKPQRTQSSERPPTKMTSPRRERGEDKRSSKTVKRHLTRAAVLTTTVNSDF